jgi:hypothetical protein
VQSRLQGFLATFGEETALNTRITLEQLKSGPIELVWNGVFLRTEFNVDCLEALKFCKGMCCRMRSGYSVELEPEEVDKYVHREHPTRPGVQILAAKKNSESCFYLDDETSLCTIHAWRPRMCAAWHCSPGGNPGDGGIERRDAGWMWLPLRKEEAELVQIQMNRT